MEPYMSMSMNNEKSELGDAIHIAVIIPCYNVERHVEEVVRSIPDFVETVVAVDDCSTDRTAEKLHELSDPRLTVAAHNQNQGIGGAMCTGYRIALDQGATICVKMDGDGQMDPDFIPDLVEPLVSGEADYVKGNRFHHIGGLKTMPTIRLLGNGLLSFATKLVSGYWSIFDPTNGFTAIRSAVLQHINLDRFAKRYFFETSVLTELNIEGAAVCDVEMPAQYGDEPSSLSIKSIIRSFPFLMIRALARRFFWRYLVSDFNALTLCVLVGIPFLLFGVTFGSYHWIQSIQTGNPATAGTVFVAALPIILGFQTILVALVLDMLYQPSVPLSDPLVNRTPQRSSYLSEDLPEP